MCGLSGYYSPEGHFGSEDLVRMNRALLHRGPDAEGIFVRGPAGLAHRRLSIIDLSAGANQPMISGNGRYVIIYNGEVYNFREIRQQLHGIVTLKTASDTEVIVEAFSCWGPGFVNRLNGMFALAVYDLETSGLYLFRDRIGIKPLYYYANGSDLVFSSELKGLMAVPAIRSAVDIDPVAVNEFLHLGYVPEPHSIYGGIRKFPSGHYLKVGLSGTELVRYWNPDDKIAPSVLDNEEEAKQRLKELLQEAVRLRLVSDVPFGTFLSGGIDSSLVTALAARVGDKPLNTFSIGFTDSKYDESGYARAVAEHLGTRHHEFTVSEEDARTLVPSIPEIYDEPYADSSAVPALLISKLARQQVTMTLSGDGGDELFFGYGAYRWAGRLDQPLAKHFGFPAAWLLSRLGSRARRASGLFGLTDPRVLRSHIFSQEQYLFSRHELTRLLHPDLRREIFLDEVPGHLARELTPAESQSLFDLKYYLKDDLLVKVDRASMHHSLETRVPLLDYRIVEFALNLAPSLKYRKGTSKYLLRQVLFDYLPREFFERPKWGFAVPLAKWLRNELRDLPATYLSEKKVRESGFFDHREVLALLNRFDQKNNSYLYNRVWQLIVFQMFIENQRG